MSGHTLRTMARRPEPPAELARVAPGWNPELAYRLVPGVTTWRLHGPGGAVRYAKIDTEGRYPGLEREAERMRWARQWLPVPDVVSLERFGTTTVLLTDALEGRDATDSAWRRDVRGLVRAFGRGLRSFHEAVATELCPFRFDVERALAHVGRRVALDDIDAAGFHAEHAHLTPGAALTELQATAPAEEDLVVCHGDYCPPNVLLVSGRVTGYLDLGELGVADRWCDVAVGGWSTCWNFGDELEPLFYEGYGIAPDPERIRFYRLLYDVVS
jgi:kanamycin kinase